MMEELNGSERDVLINNKSRVQYATGDINTLLTNVYYRDGSKNLEQIYLNRKIKSVEGTRTQMKNTTKWFNEDKKLLNSSHTIRELDKFVSGDFEILNINNDKFVQEVPEWTKIPKQPEDEGGENHSRELTHSKVLQGQNIILKNKIIKLDQPVLNLRSLGVEAELEILMSGESSFYIFSRGIGNFSNEMAICYFEKELDSSRKFVSFAILEKSDIDNNLHFKTLKKQEIPKQDNYIKTMDVSELKFSFFDNGDNKCYITVEHGIMQINK